MLDISDCAVTDTDVSVMCRGLADARCRLRVLRLAGNVDLSDRGANGTLNFMGFDFAMTFRNTVFGFPLYIFYFSLRWKIRTLCTMTPLFAVRAEAVRRRGGLRHSKGANGNTSWFLSDIPLVEAFCLSTVFGEAIKNMGTARISTSTICGNSRCNKAEKRQLIFRDPLKVKYERNEP